MKTLTIISHKGGAGKTSSAVMLAEDFARRGLRVVLVDADRHRGAGIILGVEQASGEIQQTRDPKLRYLCSSGLPLRELAVKHQELTALCDVAVVDTPSLDDPLAKGWIQLSTEALMVIPVEPISMRTLESADAAIETIRKLNSQIRPLGIMPTMFDETDATQRTLMLELQSLRGDEVLPVHIPLDSGLAHRAEQKQEKRTEPSETTRAAYQQAGDHLMKVMNLKADPSAAAAMPAQAMAAPAPAAPAPAPMAAGPAFIPPQHAPVAAAVARPSVPVIAAMSPPPSRPSPLKWVFALVLVAALAAGGYWGYMKFAKTAESPAPKRAAKAVKSAKHVPAGRPERR